MIRLAVLACVLVAAPTRAAAEDGPRERADALVREGNELGRAGQLAEAIERFKQAEQLHPRAVPLCNAGLAFGKLGKLALSHLYLRRCRERWTATEDRAAPAWIDAELVRLDKLLAADHGRIDLGLAPAGARAVVSAFAADDPIPPGPVWLPLGEHTLTVSADGYETVTGELRVDRDGGRFAAVLKRIAPPVPDRPQPEPQAPPPAAERPPAPPEVDRPPPPRSRLPLYTGVGGALLLGGGVTFHVLALGAKAEAEKYAVDDPRFDDHAGDFRRDRALAIGLYAGAGVAAAVTTYLIVRDRRRGPAVSAAPTRGGALASLTWTLP